MAAVSFVRVEADAFMVCLTHALSTDREEVMGLLIGEVDEFNISHVYTVFMLRRSDKRKDRVEISPEQLSHASTQAERLGLLTPKKRPMRILGWYHSHPHITVWPSHVDVQTQAMYQMMDEGFVGLIFSCFNEDSGSSVDRVEKRLRRDYIVDFVRDFTFVSEKARATIQELKQLCFCDLLKSGHLQVTCFQSQVLSYPSSKEYKRREISMEILPSETISDACLEALVQLPDILGQEEEEVFHKTLSNINNDLLTAVHNGTVFTKSLCHVIEVMCGPLMQTFENRLERNKRKEKELLKEKEELERRLEALRNA